jgi:hypothetical protein
MLLYNIPPQPPFSAACPLAALPPRMWTWLICGHLADELLEDGVGEGLVALSRDDEGSRAADHVVSERSLKIEFQHQDPTRTDNAGSNSHPCTRHRQQTPKLAYGPRPVVCFNHAPVLRPRAPRETGSSHPVPTEARALLWYARGVA